MTDTKFKPGKSGNPAGRPKGSKDKRTQNRDLFNQHAPKLIEKAVAMALDGNVACLKMCMDRIVPPCREEKVNVQIESTTDTPLDQAKALISKAMEGSISPEVATKLMSLLVELTRISEIQSRIVDFDDEPLPTEIIYNVKPAVGDIKVSNRDGKGGIEIIKGTKALSPEPTRNNS